jgi:hypothetical protein
MNVCKGLCRIQVALDMLGTVVRASSTPLSDEIMSTFLPTVQCVMKTDDNATMQSGGETLRAFASVGIQQVANLRDDYGLCLSFFMDSQRQFSILASSSTQILLIMF